MREERLSKYCYKDVGRRDGVRKGEKDKWKVNGFNFSFTFLQHSYVEIADFWKIKF